MSSAEPLGGIVTTLAEQAASPVRAGMCSLARVISAIGELPAVPTQDWCDRAAGAIGLADHAMMSVVLVVQLDADGGMVGHESIGAWCPVSGERSRVSLESSGAVASLLKAAGFRLGQVPQLAGGSRRVVGVLDAIDAAWRVGPVGRLWAPFTSDESRGGACLAAEPLGTRAGRMLIVMTAPVEPGPVNGRATAEVLLAALPWLTARAVLALGKERLAESRWLSPREQEVLELLVRGLSIKEIGEVIGRSHHTVHDHVKALHRKLDASTRGELIARALGRGESANPVASVVEPKPGN